MGTYEDNEGNFSWGLFADANNKAGGTMLNVPSDVKIFVKNNYELLSWMTGSIPPYEQKTLFGFDYLRPDTDRGYGQAWFFQHFSILENTLYEGLKVGEK